MTYMQLHQILYDEKKRWLANKGLTVRSQLTKEQERALEAHLQEYRRGLRR
jgi:hypothetical protein